MNSVVDEDCSIRSLSRSLLDVYGINPCIDPVKYSDSDRLTWMRVMAKALCISNDMYLLHCNMLLPNINKQVDEIDNCSIDGEKHAITAITEFLRKNYTNEWGNLETIWSELVKYDVDTSDNKKLRRSLRDSLKLFATKVSVDFLPLLKIVYNEKANMDHFAAIQKVAALKQLSVPPLYVVDDKLFSLVQKFNDYGTEKKNTTNADMTAVADQTRQFRELQKDNFCSIPQTGRYYRNWGKLKSAEILERKTEAIAYMLAIDGIFTETAVTDALLILEGKKEKIKWTKLWKTSLGKLDVVALKSFLAEEPKVITGTETEHLIIEKNINEKTKINDTKSHKIILSDQIEMTLTNIALRIIAQRGDSLQINAIVSAVAREYDLPLAVVRPRIVKVIEKISYAVENFQEKTSCADGDSKPERLAQPTARKRRATKASSS